MCMEEGTREWGQEPTGVVIGKQGAHKHVHRLHGSYVHPPTRCCQEAHAATAHLHSSLTGGGPWMCIMELMPAAALLLLLLQEWGGDPDVGCVHCQHQGGGPGG
jgi:hypothetical protein